MSKGLWKWGSISEDIQMKGIKEITPKKCKERKDLKAEFLSKTTFRQVNEFEDKQQGRWERKGKMICNRKVGRNVSQRGWKNSHSKESKKKRISVFHLLNYPIKLEKCKHEGLNM